MKKKKTGQEIKRRKTKEAYIVMSDIRTQDNISTVMIASKDFRKYGRVKRVGEDRNNSILP
jgi:hypothetical protein